MKEEKSQRVLKPHQRFSFFLSPFPILPYRLKRFLRLGHASAKTSVGDGKAFLKWEGE